MNDEPSPSVTPPSAPAERADTVLDWARDAGAEGLLVNGLDRYVRRRRRRRIAFASTACAALLVAAAIWVPRRVSPSPVIETAVVMRPEQRTLSDGSTVDLNAGAEIEVRFTATLRQVVLRKGEAHFQVSKNPQRPFVVTAGGFEVRAVGTAFAVDLGASEVGVLVTEGHVAVNHAERPAMAEAGTDNAASGAPSQSTLASLGAGRGVVIEREVSVHASAVPRVAELSPAEIQARLAWRVPRLKFSATPLPQVVAMFNEHAMAGRDARLVLAPDLAADVRVSGTLRADDVDSLLRLLAGEFGISAEPRAGEIVLRRK